MTTIAIVSVMLLVACDAPTPPVVSKPAPSLDGEDRAIMKAVLDDLLRAERDRSIQRGPRFVRPTQTTASFLVFDATIAICRRQEPFGPFGLVRGCIDAEWLEHLSRVTTAPRLSAMAAFASRNSRSLRIHEPLSDDVTLIPADIDPPRFRELLKRRRESTHIMGLSAPVYPGAGSAVIAYRYFWSGRGFVGLSRSNGGWVVATRSGSVE